MEVLHDVLAIELAVTPGEWCIWPKWDVQIQDDQIVEIRLGHANGFVDRTRKGDRATPHDKLVVHYLDPRLAVLWFILDPQDPHDHLRYAGSTMLNSEPFV